MITMFFWFWVFAVLSFAVVPLAFAIAGDEQYSSDMLMFLPMVPEENFKPNAYLFDIFGGNHLSFDEPTFGRIFIIIGLGLQAFDDFCLSIFIIGYRMHHANDVSGGFGRRNWMTFAIVFLQLILLVVQLVGFQTGSELLLVWPVANFLRFLDTLMVLVFRSKKLSRCYGENYNCLFFTCDIFGSAAGFLMTRDPLWLKIVNVLIEAVDTLFAAVVEASNLGALHLNLVAKHIFSIVKYVSLALKVFVTLPGYILMYTRKCSLVTGCVFGVFAFVTMLLLEIQSMTPLTVNIFGGNLLIPCVYIVAPFVVVVVLFSIVVMCCMRTDVPYSQSQLLNDVEEDDDNEVENKVVPRLTALEMLEMGTVTSGEPKVAPYASAAPLQSQAQTRVEIIKEAGDGPTVTVDQTRAQDDDDPKQAQAEPLTQASDGPSGGDRQQPETNAGADERLANDGYADRKKQQPETDTGANETDANNSYAGKDRQQPETNAYADETQGNEGDADRNKQQPEADAGADETNANDSYGGRDRQQPEAKAYADETQGNDGGADVNKQQPEADTGAEGDGNVS